MNKKLIFIIGLVVLVVAAPLIQASLRGTAAVEVEVEKLEPRVIRSSVLASGKLVHEEEVKLTTEEIGRVTAIYVDEGESVKKGDLVLQIDDQRLRAAVDQAEASVRMQEIAIQRQQLEVENLRTQWNRMQGLHERKLIDEDSFVTATNNLEIAEIDLMSSRESLQQARAQLDQQEDRLAKTRVYSPIDGAVTTLDIKVGETAIASSTNIPGSSLMTIANPASIHTEVNVDEADIANVEVGQKAQVFAIAYPDQPVEGVVEEIADGLGIPRRDAPIAEATLRSADEIWLGAATREVQPVTRLDGAGGLESPAIHRWLGTVGPAARSSPRLGPAFPCRGVLPRLGGGGTPRSDAAVPVRGGYRGGLTAVRRAAQRRRALRFREPPEGRRVDRVHLPPVGWQVGHVLPGQEDAPARRRLETRDHAQGRRLAAAGRAEEGDELAFAHAERHVVDGGEAAGEGLGHALQADDVGHRGFRRA